MAASTRDILLTPRWLVLTGLLLAGVVAMVALGLWQWQRSAPPDVAARATSEVSAVDVASLPAVTDVVGWTGVSGGLAPADVGRLVSVEGRWRDDLTLLVAEREPPAAAATDEPGLWVVTPVVLAGEPTTVPESEPAGGPTPEVFVPVVRGWVPGTDRVDVAEPPPGPVTVVGWLQPSEGLDLPADPVQPDGVVPLLASADLVNRWPGELVRNFVVAADSAEAPGSAVVPLGAPLEDASAQPRNWRNVAYSLQWYVFAGFAVLLWWRMLRDERRRRPTATEEPSALDDAPGPGDEDGSGGVGEDGGGAAAASPPPVVARSREGSGT